MRFRIEVGYQHDVKPGNIVGAIANEADLDSEYIGHIEIYEDHSTVDLPAGMPKETFIALRKARVCQHRLDISVAGEAAPEKKRKQLSFKSRKKGKAGAKRKGKPGAGERPKKKPGRKPGKKARP
ncbi:MAG: DbpA RNA binding domain-containing protein [Thiogranum sp.]